MTIDGKTIADLRTDIDLGFQVSCCLFDGKEDYIFRHADERYSDGSAYIWLRCTRDGGKPYVTIYACVSLDEILQAKNGMLHAPVWTPGTVPDDVMAWFHAGLPVMQEQHTGGLFMEDNPLYDHTR